MDSPFFAIVSCCFLDVYCFFGGAAAGVFPFHPISRRRPLFFFLPECFGSFRKNGTPQRTPRNPQRATTATPGNGRRGANGTRNNRPARPDSGKPEPNATTRTASGEQTKAPRHKDRNEPAGGNNGRRREPAHHQRRAARNRRRKRATARRDENDQDTTRARRGTQTRTRKDTAARPNTGSTPKRKQNQHEPATGHLLPPAGGTSAYGPTPPANFERLRRRAGFAAFSRCAQLPGPAVYW